MPWTLQWLGPAKKTWASLKPRDQRLIAAELGAFATLGPGSSSTMIGLLLMDRWRVGFAFERDAGYVNDDGEPDRGDVLWVHHIWPSPPDDIDLRQWVDDDE
jgi:hypothetical protein